jgi:hypothetical protein
MTKNNTPQVGSFVRIGNQILLVECIEDDIFFGSDSDGDEREYQMSQIDQVM